jgi:hypothetical protein
MTLRDQIGHFQQTAIGPILDALLDEVEKLQQDRDELARRVSLLETPQPSSPPEAA